MKIQLQYISKIWFSTRIKNQNPETRKVTLDYKFDLPVVEFGIKFHGSDDKCQIRGSGRSRTIELDACGGWTTTGALYAARFWTLWPPVPFQFQCDQISLFRRSALSHVCTPSKSGFSWFYTASGPLRKIWVQLETQFSMWRRHTKMSSFIILKLHFCNKYAHQKLHIKLLSLRRVGSKTHALKTHVKCHTKD